MIFSTSPVGVFDSGIGGLSVLQALRHELPHESFVYLADSGNAPYGDARGDVFVQQRTRAIAHYLREQYAIKALVIACNTATAAAVEMLRAHMPDLPLIGVEPAIKPAALSSQTGHVGVMATRGTVSSARFTKLLAMHGGGRQFHVQACDGLAKAIEQSTEEPEPLSPETTEIRALCARYTSALGHFGHKTGEIDALVLGCTHYVFVREHLRALLGPDIQLIDTGAAVARQTRRVLLQIQALAAEGEGKAQGRMHLMTTGSLAALQSAARRWLELPAQDCSAVVVPEPAVAA
ncbi:glutamate racemase [Comamonas composti]|uniref:glutamate racemase n=1 Tax=Comamonas composti TaxID=408558 RepID=UPI0004795079|nr:glutamate racemase [Comamonas composti]